MPVPRFINIPSHHVLRTDDILVNPSEKKNDPNGEPQEIDFIDVGEKWVYINLKNPVNRRRVFKFEIDEQVHVVRVVDTAEDVAAKTGREIVNSALNDQKSLWFRRQRLAHNAMNIQTSRSYHFSSGSSFKIASARELVLEAQRIQDLEYAGQRWSAVAMRVELGRADTLIQALYDVLEDTKEQIVRGFASDENLEAVRSWIREVENITRRHEVSMATSERSLG